MKTIVILSCYFGKKPDGFENWLKSCEKNSSIDWLIFTDVDELISIRSVNVKFEKITLDYLRKIIEEKLNMKVSLEKPYKLCDFKPIYGYIFQKYIYKYDFWGYCDMDMIFGNIRKFISDDILDKYDKIYHLGHLSLYRNTEEVNTKFMKIIDDVNYKKAFTTNNICVFDEIDGIFKLFEKNKIYLSPDYVDINRFSNKLLLNGEKVNNIIVCPIHNYKYQTFLYDNGTLYMIFFTKGKINYKEIIYIHYSGRKFKDLYENSYFITNKGFVTYNGEKVDKKMIKKLNNIKSIKFEKLKKNVKYFFFRINRKLKKIMVKFNERV